MFNQLAEIIQHGWIPSTFDIFPIFQKCSYQIFLRVHLTLFQNFLGKHPNDCVKSQRFKDIRLSIVDKRPAVCSQAPRSLDLFCCEEDKVIADCFESIPYLTVYRCHCWPIRLCFEHVCDLWPKIYAFVDVGID